MVNVKNILFFDEGETDMARLDKKDVLRMAKEKKVKFVRLWFTDILGFLKSFDSLPGNLYEAIQVTEESQLVKEALGEDLFYKFIDNKKIKWDRYRAQVTDYELNEYLSIL
jgi:glutamine synthetase